MAKTFSFYRALSHIFVFHEESSHGLCEYFDDEMWDELFAEFRKLYPYELIPEKVSDLSANIIKVGSALKCYVSSGKTCRF
jgi:hypothetical protein